MGNASNSLSRSASSRDRLLSIGSDTSSLADGPLHCLEPWLLPGVRETGREFGRGSFAVVNELEIRGKKAAGKRLHESLYDSATPAKRDEMLARFAIECGLLQSVKHPNIVRFLGVHVERDCPLPYLVMEYMETTLAAYLEKNGVPEPAVYYNVFSDVALGLRYMHDKSPQIIHRDISANNVLLTPSLHGKISDLGVSKVLDVTPSEKKTRLTQTLGPGTFCYMPPEALVEAPHYDAKIDVFSYGILMMHVISNEWPQPTASTIIDPHTDQLLPVTEFERRIHCVTKIQGGLDHPAIPILRKCIQNSPSNRPDMNTVTQLVIDLQMKEDEGKVYHPREPYDPTSSCEVSLGVGDDVRVFGNGRKLLKTYCLTSGEIGYVPPNVLRPLEHCPKATALYTSPAETGEGLSISQGDNLTLLSVDNEEWWYAINESTGKTGFIPCNYVTECLACYKWYLGNTSHKDADNLLKQNRCVTGSFLVHDECQDVRCLTVRGKDSITHYRIQERDKLFFIVENTVFKTLKDLVHYYGYHSNGVLSTSLKRPYDVPRGDDEVPRHQVKLTHKIGLGKFGEVWHGVKGDDVHVAVKILNMGLATKSDFLREAMVLSELNHPKIISCEGVCSTAEPVYLLTEFLKYGNLQDYLQKGEGRGVHYLDLVSLALQVAGGMAYLERQGYIHCDLGARSVAVGEGKICKIQNFERARRASCYKLPPRTSVPVRWTAPEVFATNEYTTKADVWAFGVVVMEIITRGKRPYNHMTNEETLKAVQSGYRMSQPHDCPRGLYELLLKCWCEDSNSRLRFEALEWQLEEFFVSQCFEDRTYVAPAHINKNSSS